MSSGRLCNKIAVAPSATAIKQASVANIPLTVSPHRVKRQLLENISEKRERFMAYVKTLYQRISPPTVLYWRMGMSLLLASVPVWLHVDVSRGPGALIGSRDREFFRP